MLKTDRVDVDVQNGPKQLVRRGSQCGDRRGFLASVSGTPHRTINTTVISRPRRPLASSCQLELLYYIFILYLQLSKPPVELADTTRDNALPTHPRRLQTAAGQSRL